MNASNNSKTAHDLVILVDENDNEIGTAEKLEAHQNARLHRAISVLISDSQGRWLLQQRAKHKYHCPTLWTNTCCTHPRPGETVRDAANRRLNEEMGLQTVLTRKFAFIYYASFRNGLTEHEYDHVFVGQCDDVPSVNPREVMAWRWAYPHDIVAEIEHDPDRFTPWFRLMVQRLESPRNRTLKTLAG